MPDINSTMQILEPILGPLNQLMSIIQYLVGGIFGLYLILVILRWYESRKLARLMKEVKEQLEALNKHFGVRQKKTQQKSIIKNKLRKISKKIKK